MSRKPLGTYWFCQDCEYIFREPSERPTVTEEKARYDEHRNVESPGYRAFYSGLLQAVDELHVKGQGLDFGCGPTAYLSTLLAERGLESVANFDPFFRNDLAVMDRSYDFITSTEVFEHLREPRETFQRLLRMLNPGGFLLLMTSAPPKDLAEFDNWSYRRDLTHIGFFSRKTFEIPLAAGVRVERAQTPLWIFQKMS